MQIRRELIVIATAVLFVGVTAVAQQQPSAPQESTAKGQLVRVDTTAKTITIKSADAQMVFTYSDDTKVTGADNPAGLGTLEGEDVTITYTKRGQENIATKVEVQKKPAA